MPYHDLYSFSETECALCLRGSGCPSITAAGLYHWAGLKGIVLAAGVIIGIFGALLLWRMIAAGAHPFAALLTCLFSFSASSIHFLARPHIYTLLLLSISMALLEAHRRQRSRESARRLWWLVPMTLVWTNLHGGFLILVLMLGLATALVRRWLKPICRKKIRSAWDAGALDLGQVWLYARLTAACAAVSLVNPVWMGLAQARDRVSAIGLDQNGSAGISIAQFPRRNHAAVRGAIVL